MAQDKWWSQEVYSCNLGTNVHNYHELCPFLSSFFMLQGKIVHVMLKKECMLNCIYALYSVYLCPIHSVSHIKTRCIAIIYTSERYILHFFACSCVMLTKFFVFLRYHSIVLRLNQTRKWKNKYYKPCAWLASPYRQEKWQRCWMQTARKWIRLSRSWRKRVPSSHPFVASGHLLDWQMKFFSFILIIKNSGDLADDCQPWSPETLFSYIVVIDRFSHSSHSYTSRW